MTVHLFSTTELHQLLKLPVIFEHFADHRKENKAISFLQFLDMHYLHGSPKDKDYNEDMKLPFKSSHNCTITLSPVLVPQFVRAIDAPLAAAVAKRIHIPKARFVPFSYLANIWQPPRA